MTGALIASVCKSTNSRKFTSSSVKVCFAFCIAFPRSVLIPSSSTFLVMFKLELVSF